ncbi:MAG: hypothetical protein H6631_09000 [Anaerolineaceae bacterium]|nr:hypothetical protein [Anaerolineaceae bacterium]
MRSTQSGRCAACRRPLVTCFPRSCALQVTLFPCDPVPCDLATPRTQATYTITSGSSSVRYLVTSANPANAPNPQPQVE